MSDQALLQGETVAMASSNDTLCLTNFRVKYEISNSGVSAYQSIPLAKISCCSLITKKYPLLLVLAALAGVGVFAAPSDQVRIIGAIVALVLFVAYFVTRSGRIEIASDSGIAISVPTQGLKHEEARGFVEAVSAAIMRVNAQLTA